MAEKLPRFSKEEVFKTEFNSNSGGGRTSWMDVPDLLGDTELLGLWEHAGEGTVSHRLYSRIQEASHAIGNLAANGVRSEHPGVMSQEALKLRILLSQIQRNKQAISLVEPMQTIVRDSTALDRDIFRKKIDGFNRLARSRTPLFAAGWELGLGHSPTGISPGFAGRLRGVMPLVFPNGDVNMEPVIESIDGRKGLFPLGVGLEGLYKVVQATTYTKKFLVGREDEITEEEKRQSELDYEEYMTSSADSLQPKT
jgi:hypothetical protein